MHSKTTYKALIFRLIRKLTIHRFDAYIHKASSETINNFSMTIAADKLKKEEEEEDEERYSCWCFLLIDGTKFEAKIVHKGRGKFKILNDEYGGKYNNKIVDASDVIRCKIEI
ncbi:MAG: hypothetical protein ACJ72F_03540 [Nitrososphaeraceae archaeon]